VPDFSPNPIDISGSEPSFPWVDLPPTLVCVMPVKYFFQVLLNCLNSGRYFLTGFPRAPFSQMRLFSLLSFGLEDPHYLLGPYTSFIPLVVTS